ncbi:MAG: alpha/beta hydrolase, partial [Planctomycetota bacterium]
MRKFQWWMLDGDEADHIRMQVRYGENGPDSVLADLEFVVPEWFDLDLLMTPDGTGDVSVLEAQLEHAQQVAEELMQPLQEPLRASLPASLVIRFPASGFAARDWIESIPWEIIPFRFVDEDHETPPVLGHQFVSIADIRGDLSEDDLNDARRTPILMIERPAFSTDHAHRVDGIEGRVQTVFFGTNRNLTVRRGYVFDDGYGQVQVAPGMSHLRTGRCDVWVPAGHQTGQLRGDGWGRWFGLPADALEIRELQLLGSEILDEMRRVLSIDGPDRHHMLFIHGFNVSFADALLRTAQLGTDLGIQGVASAF